MLGEPTEQSEVDVYPVCQMCGGADFGSRLLMVTPSSCVFLALTRLERHVGGAAKSAS